MKENLVRHTMPVSRAVQ